MFTQCFFLQVKNKGMFTECRDLNTMWTYTNVWRDRGRFHKEIRLVFLKLGPVTGFISYTALPRTSPKLRRVL